MSKSVLLAAVLVTVVYAQRWTSVSPVPLVPSGRPVDDGAWLESVRDPQGLVVYAAKGNRTLDFYCYDPVMDSWNEQAPIPLGTENKALDQGARAVWDGAGSLYMTKGNNSLGFYQFDIAADSWYQLPDVPTGPDSLKLRGGSDIVYLRKDSIPYVYLLKGEAGEFYRINLSTLTWEPLGHAPVGAQVEWFHGSWLEYDGVHRIYAYKARTNEFWAYDVSRDEWETRALCPMPLVGRRGIPLPASHGCAAAWYNGAAYALKGNGTPELWRYVPAADSWQELDESPVSINGGGALCQGDSASVGEQYFFALAGDERQDFLRYRLPFIGIEERGATQPRFRLSVVPNPVTSGQAQVRVLSPGSDRPTLRLFDAVGRCRWGADGVAGASGIALPQLEGGVYLLRGVFAGEEASARFVVLR